MSDVAEVIERLLKARTPGYEVMCVQAADLLSSLSARIAELERERDAVVAEHTFAGQSVAHLHARAESAEAKLVKAVEALKFYRDEFKVKVGKPMPGASGITYHPSEALLDDCGNRAIDALAALSPMPNKEG